MVVDGGALEPQAQRLPVDRTDDLRGHQRVTPQHAAEGGSCVLVSHHRNALDRADRVLAMADGVLQ